MNKSKDVDAYIARFGKEHQVLMKEIRALIRSIAPLGEEVLSYHMPAYKYHGMLVYFGAHTNHVGLYPMPSAITRFKKELASYQTSKSTVQFPLGAALPKKLITQIIEFRIKENVAKAAAKKKPRV